MLTFLSVGRTAEWPIGVRTCEARRAGEYTPVVRSAPQTGLVPDGVRTFDTVGVAVGQVLN
jgi:hypothetical protein